MRSALAVITALLVLMVASPAPRTAAAATDSVQRMAGPDRYATAAAISAGTFAPGVPTVFIATGRDFPDALAAAPAAAKRRGPLLLVTASTIPGPTASELTRLRPSRIEVVGSAGVISDAVLAALDVYDTGGGVARVAGPDRFATAAAISRGSFDPSVPVLFVATGRNFPDALAAAPVAGRLAAPILLVDSASVPAVVLDEVRRLAPRKIVVMGSSGVVSGGVADQLRTVTADVIRIGGADRFETAAMVNGAFTPVGSRLMLAVGSNFPDALAGAAASVPHGAGILLTKTYDLTTPTRGQVSRIAPNRVYLLGSTGVVSERVRRDVAVMTGVLPALPPCTYTEQPTARPGYDKWATVIVDTNYALPSGYQPGDLFNSSSAGVNGGYLLKGVASADLAAMAADARVAGVTVNIDSGFRSYTEQEATFTYYVGLIGWNAALLRAARAGHSEHQLGTAIDLVDTRGGYDWVEANGWQYGWVESYPDGSAAVTCYSYEPWHYRYVGRPMARAVHESSLTLREYLWLINGGNH
jgi:LAS superfamily LD-carboxypeptidase LdcB/putative cell wall-binding protein